MRKVRQKHIDEANFINRMALQVSRVEEEGILDTETRNALINVLHRMHTGVLADSGTLDRMRQDRYNKRVREISTSTLFDIFVGSILMILVLLWLVYL